MVSDMSILALNTLSGKTAVVSEREFKHPVLGKNLVEVDEAKDYVPELYKPKTAAEFEDGKKARAKKIEPAEEISTAEIDGDK